MFSRKMIPLVALLLLLQLALSTGCPGGSREDNSEKNSARMKIPPPEVSDIENLALDIMKQADLIPAVERIAAQGEQSVDSVNQLTFDQTLLGETLSREMNAGGGGDQGQEKLPRDSAEIWNRIKMNVADLHDRWDKLEPRLVQEKTADVIITSFEAELDRMTVQSTEQKQNSILWSANQLTKYLSQAMVSFTEATVGLAHELKYHLRNILLQASAGRYEEAMQSMLYLQEQRNALTGALPEEDSAEFSTSLDNLQRALEKQNLELVKIYAAEVMENLVQIIEKL